MFDSVINQTKFAVTRTYFDGDTSVTRQRGNLQSHTEIQAIRLDCPNCTEVLFDVIAR